MKKLILTFVTLSFALIGCSSPDGGILSSENYSNESPNQTLQKTIYGVTGSFITAPTGTQYIHFGGFPQAAAPNDTIMVGDTLTNIYGSSYQVFLEGKLAIETDPGFPVTISKPVYVQIYDQNRQAWLALDSDATVYTSMIKIADTGSCTMTLKATAVLRVGFSEND